MRVATGTLFGRKSLTLVEAGEPGADPWHFLAFEDVEAQEIIRLDARYLLVLGCRAAPEVDPVAVFDLVERRRVFEIRRKRLSSHRWCYSPAQRAFFFAQREKDWLCHSLYERSIDGEIDRKHRIDGFRISEFGARDDGTIVCVEQGLHEDRIAILDPATGEVRLTHLPHPPQGSQPETRLRWLSPDGRWALRNHLDTLPRASGRTGLLSRFLRSAPADKARHPDLSDGERRFGIALDLIPLDPEGAKRTIVIRYMSLAEFKGLPSFGEVLDALASSGAPLLPLREGSEEPIEDKLLLHLLHHLHDVAWDADSQGFTVFFAQVQRHVTIDGEIGPLEPVTDWRNRNKLPSLSADYARKAGKPIVQGRSSQQVALADLSGPAIAAALDEMRQRIETQGPEALSFAGVLAFRFKTGGKSIGEKALFQAVRDLPASEQAPLLPALRALLTSYGRAAGSSWLSSGSSDTAPGALAEAALALAELDENAFLYLREWIAALDQEHDQIASEKLFPILARRTRFATPEALRFGLWFFLQQWQTVSYEKRWHGLFAAAPGVIEPAPFARMALEESRVVVAASDGASDLESCLVNLCEAMPGDFWGKAATRELERLFGEAIAMEADSR
ncbi:hypothetical protein [Sphingomonas sp. NIBR02145]|uniref:hypothetical protein n=1 Tax=Sphingomonas sp. NIBR02145 TaxID=3014784 RepID=UPI0022B48A35|nr:hypothetical protein [Sphingomonas sp. NIBR02145]WHU04016.1 hypothetical protein O3305_05325 [Sphingomonas sp. NIBR02145]